MKCQKVRQKLPLFSGSDLSCFCRRKVKEHLSVCETCRAELEMLDRIRNGAADAMKALTPEAETLWGSVMNRLPERSGQKVKNPWPKAVRIVSPVLAVGLALFFLMIARDRPEQNNHTPVASMPVVESVDMENVTVMTLQTDDPHVTIVWIVEDDKS